MAEVWCRQRCGISHSSLLPHIGLIGIVVDHQDLTVAPCGPRSGILNRSRPRLALHAVVCTEVWPGSVPIIVQYSPRDNDQETKVGRSSPIKARAVRYANQCCHLSLAICISSPSLLVHPG